MGTHTELVQSMNAAPTLFRGASTVDAKLNVLANSFADALAWRAEEAEIMRRFKERQAAMEKRLKRLELEFVHEDGPGAGTYMMRGGEHGRRPD